LFDLNAADVESQLLAGGKLMDDRPPFRAIESRAADGGRWRDPDYAPLNLREVLAKFWSRRRLIVSLAIIGGGLSYGAAKLITPTYSADALVMIRPQLASEAATNASVRAAIQGGPEAVPSEAIVLQSRDLVSKTIERLHLDQDPEFDPRLRGAKPSGRLSQVISSAFGAIQGLREGLVAFLSGAAGTPATGDETTAAVEARQAANAGVPSATVVNAVSGKLRVEVLPRSNVIQVSFKSARAITAAAVPNTLAQLYVERLGEAKDRALAEERGRLDTLVLPTLRKKLQTSELALAAYRQKSELSSDKDPKILERDLSEIGTQLSAARAREAEATARLTAIGALVSSPRQVAPTDTGSPAAAVESQVLQRLYDREVELQAQLSGLSASLGPNNPKVQELEARSVQVRGAMRRASAGLVGRLRAEVAAAQAAEAALKRREADFARQFALVSGGDAKLQGLIRDVDTDRQTYEKYLGRSNEIYASIGQAQPDATLVSRAAVPFQPSFPNTKFLAGAGAAIGAAIGIVLAPIVDLLLGGLRSARQVEDVLGVRCLGLVPRLRWHRRNLSFAAEMRRVIEDPASAGARAAAFGRAIRGVQFKLVGVERGPHGKAADLRQHGDDMDSPARSLDRIPVRIGGMFLNHREIRQSLDSVDRGGGSQVVLVTAALPREGKSWVAVSLAASLAAEGLRVALVDCDLHRPTIHRMFDGPYSPGLTDYFGGAAGIDEVVHPDSASGVEYVPIGSDPSSEAWYITLDRLRRLVAQLQGTYRFIILDSAPVLAVSETAMLSQIAQKTIFVARWGRTHPQIARHAVMQLYDSGAVEVAAVLSMVDFRRAAKDGDVVAGTYRRLQSYYIASRRLWQAGGYG
jgi:uncharacterized protein involved in exopolysaccharide biosynthesis/Mrp family chromosome partitioning ATPase